VPICVSCGAENPEDTRYCAACGVELGRVTSPDAHPDEVIEDDVTTGGASATERAQQTPVAGETRDAGTGDIPPADRPPADRQPADRPAADRPPADGDA
jgi:hypothetical protein